MSVADRRWAIEAQRPARHGGGVCTLLLVRVHDRIELLPHAVDSWACELDEARALELAKALRDLIR